MTRLITICSILAIVLAITSVAYCGTISGTVTNGSGSGISGLTVQVYEYPPEDDDELTSVLTNSSGIYTIPDLPAGQYMVAAFPGLTSLPYINEIYNDTMFYLEATPVTVTTSGTTSGIDFQLAASGMITGTVTNAATGDPIVGIWVLADNYDDEEGMFSDAKFDFFDPHDLVQVKYEMLRTVDKEGKSVKQASEAYGFSRPAFYQAQSQFKKSGVSGLIRKRPGPRSSHKITDEVLTFIEGETQEGEPLRSRKLALLIKEKFGKDVHPRSIERAIARRKKRNKDGSPAYLH